MFLIENPTVLIARPTNGMGVQNVRKPRLLEDTSLGMPVAECTAILAT
jgi:hypothetical protein